MEDVAKPDTTSRDAGQRPWVPEEHGLPLPEQDLWHFDRTTVRPFAPDRRATARRALIFATPAIVAGLLSMNLDQAVRSGSSPLLRAVLVGCFAINTYWLALLCTITLAGFLVLVGRGRLTPKNLDIAPTAKSGEKTAILIPTFDEPPENVFGLALATLRSLADEGCAEQFDVFVLSDTADPLIAQRETAVFLEARERMPSGQQIYYRRRGTNTAKKAGNITEWCRRWGGNYEAMIILDADSLMSGRTMMRMVAALEKNPQVALIQASSVLINRKTLFGRYQQFINRVYDYWSPMTAAGMAYWHRGSSSFWGHNACIRVRAFCESAGLPQLSGPPPLGGNILSHDFVEGALLRRAGWSLWLVPELQESYEEAPPSIIDWAFREQRWCQGNLQHCRLITAHGLNWISRVHLGFGIMFMASSLIWLVFAAAAILIAIELRIAPSMPPVREALQLLPGWLVRDHYQILIVLFSTVILVVLPKLLGFGLIALDGPRRAAFGGMACLCKSTVLALLMAALFAPVRILFRAQACLNVLRGRDCGWQPSRRHDDALPIQSYLGFHAPHMTVGAALAIASLALDLSIFLWLFPIFFSLIVSGPVSIACANLAIGKKMRRAGWLMVPEETNPPGIAVDASRQRALLAR
jgi:membrane glycosyltransferase